MYPAPGPSGRLPPSRSGAPAGDREESATQHEEHERCGNGAIERVRPRRRETPGGNHDRLLVAGPARRREHCESVRTRGETGREIALQGDDTLGVGVPGADDPRRRGHDELHVLERGEAAVRHLHLLAL